MPESLSVFHSQKETIRAFCQREEVDLLVLFGSGSRGATHERSDLDIALQFPEGKAVSKLHLIFELETILEPWTIDLVVLSPQTPPLLLYEIFKNGRLIYEKAGGLFDRGRLRAWHLYVDSAPLRERTRQYVTRTFRRLRHVP
jgi:uncharacterized protein